VIRAPKQLSWQANWSVPPAGVQATRPSRIPMTACCARLGLRVVTTTRKVASFKLRQTISV